MKPDPVPIEEYQDILDALRLRSETAGWLLWAVLGFLAIFVGLLWGGAVVMRRRERRHVMRGFNKLAEERGLTGEETALLLRMAREARLENLLMAFSSVSAFERGIDRLLPPEDGPERDAMVSRLQGLRTKLRFDHLPPKWALRHSRQIPLDIRILVGFKRNGRTRFCTCVVVENNAVALKVAPLVREDEEALEGVEIGERLYIRFWMERDAEYKFRSCLLPETGTSRGTLVLEHTERLERLQRRDFFRLPVHIALRFYALPDAELARLPPGEIRVEGEPRLAGTLVDLSAGGAAVQAEEGLAPGEQVVIDPLYEGDFSLAGLVCETIKSVENRADGFTNILEFVNAGDALQDRLVRELYRRQLALAQE